MIAHINNNETSSIVTNKPAVVEKIPPILGTKAIDGTQKNVTNPQENPAILGQADVSKPTVSDEVLDKTVRELNDRMKAVQRELHFSIDEDSGRTVIKVMDMETQKVIRQIPNEEALTVARKLENGIDPALFNEYS